MQGGVSEKTVLVMVGLPARGKSYTAQKLARYLRWLGYPCRVFNVGEMRRSQVGAHQLADFFDPANPEASRARSEIADSVLRELLAWLADTGGIAIYDATNTTRERRTHIAARCKAAGATHQFIEVINNDPHVIEENVRATKLTSPDYQGVDADEAVRDFRARIDHYERIYEEVEDSEGSYVKLVDRNRQVIMHAIDGFLVSHIVFFLINLQVGERPVWLTRHGESQFNVVGRIGGDAALSPRGEAYSRALAAHVHEHFPPGQPLEVWTSSLERTIETGGELDRPKRQWRSLDEIDAGVCDGMTYEEIREQFPAEYERRARDKLRYRYPRGESYQDVIQRLDQLIIEVERQRTPVLVIAHQAVLRAFYAYFMNLEPVEIPYVSIPLHTVIKLTPRAYECVEERLKLIDD